MSVMVMVMVILLLFGVISLDSQVRPTERIDLTRTTMTTTTTMMLMTLLSIE